MQNHRRVWENEEIASFRDAVRRFIARELAPDEQRWRKQGYVDRDRFRKVGELGMLCPSIPAEYGGGGGSFAHEAVMQEELAYAGCTSFAQGVHGTVCAHYLLAYGNEDQKRRWLPKLCSGEWVAAIAMTEPGAGSDLQALRTRAVAYPGETDYVVDGSKTYISNGQLADLVIVAAKTAPKAGGRGLSLIVVETGSQEGFYRGRALDKIGMHGQDTSELFFEDMRVPVANRLGEEGEGFVQLMALLPQDRLSIAVFSQVFMERAVELTVAHVKERKVFEAPLFEMQNTRFKLAECEAAARVSRSFIDDCVARHVAGELSAVDASMAKYWCTEQAFKVIDECLQLHGGSGYMSDTPIARMFVDARAHRVLGGANEVMKELIARSL